MSGSWDIRAKEIADRIAKDGIGSFMGWSVIHATMFVGDGRLVQQERKEVQHLLPLDADTNMVHQAFHLHQWIQATGLSVKDIGSVVEVGGGYGSMFCLWRKLGFVGEYYMVDYVPMHQLQRHYAEKMECNPLPRKALPPVATDILIACFSLSELTAVERDSVLRGIDFNHHLVAYDGGVWEGVDNDEYFASWGGATIRHPHHPSISYKVN